MMVLTVSNRDGERLFGSGIRWGILRILSESIIPVTANAIAIRLQADTKTTYRMVNELIASGFIRPIERRGRKALVLAENPRGQAVMKLVEAVKQPPTLTSNDFHRLLLRRSKGEIDALAAVGREAFKRTFEETPLGYRMRINA